ncbi:relaxase/mobilization nuclease domain-containing protein [Rhodococcus opacus]|uniref:relaxase/mobilization nuclease domain-containing protein n=1 Tax=Rhodococcus opacus TaxID=37919 RepID=UPI001FEF01DA|nr:relaxase/mobilization nuclease domain-containing protein [Rhodococcus opacus]
MIAYINNGSRMSGLMVYLAGPGDSNEHTDQHIVAGHSVITGRDDFAGQLDRTTALAVAHEIDLPRKLFGTKVEQVAKGKAQQEFASGTAASVAVLEATEDVNVWHCSLSIAAHEGELSDETWSQIADDFMDGMGFTGADGGVPARWVAVRHGLSENGNDHIHIAASRVREDGTVVSTWRDRVKASNLCAEIERKYGLDVIESRSKPRTERNANASVPTRAEVEKSAARRGQPSPFPGRNGAPSRRRSGSSDPGLSRSEPNQPARVQLRQVVSETAAAVSGPEEFLRELGGQGVLVYRRLDESGRMTGYAVADPADTNAKGNPIFFGGHTLAPELSWPKLNKAWESRSGMDPVPTAPRERTDTIVTRLGAATTAVKNAAEAVRTGTEDPAPIAAAAQSVLSGWARASERQSDRRDVAAISWRHADAARCGGAYEPSHAGTHARALRDASWTLSALRTFTAAGRAHAPTMELALALAALLVELSAWHERSHRPIHAQASRSAADGCRQYTDTYAAVDLYGRPKTSVPVSRPTTVRPTGVRANPTPNRSHDGRGRGQGPTR